jgi:hypothetical protein
MSLSKIDSHGSVESSNRNISVGLPVSVGDDYRLCLDRTFTGHFAPKTSGALTDAWSLRGFHDSHWTRDAMTSWAVSDRNDHQLDQFVRVLKS